MPQSLLHRISDERPADDMQALSNSFKSAPFEKRVFVRTVNAVRILIADDHTLVRAGLRMMLESEPGFQVVAEAANGREAVELAAARQPDAVIADVFMPELNGIEAARQIRSMRPATMVVLLSESPDHALRNQATSAGASAYFLKNCGPAELVQAIKQECAHESGDWSHGDEDPSAHAYSSRRLKRLNNGDAYELLTLREREVLRLLGAGRANREVAGLLNLSVHTVETHRARILKKLNLHGTADLVLYMVRKGMVSLYKCEYRPEIGFKMIKKQYQ